MAHFRLFIGLSRFFWIFVGSRAVSWL